MFHVSIIVGLLRFWPRQVFWTVTLAQAALWFLVPALFYAAPPGDLPYALAFGHEFQLGSYFGPPLVFWLAEIVYRLGGNSAVGLYLLAQIFVFTAYWAVFRLGCAIVGERHAAMATLLMVGIFALTLPTAEFGPPVVALPLTALIVLHLWRALGEGRRNYWFACALEIGLLLLTTYAGLILAGLIALFIAMTERGRHALTFAEPWMAGVIAVVVLFPHLIWLDTAGEAVVPALQRLVSAEAADDNLMAWARLAAGLVLMHAGLGVLVVLASSWRGGAQGEVPEISRTPIDPFARRFVYFFALAPGFIATIFATVVGATGPAGGAPPLVVLSGLAVVVAAGDSIRFYRQQFVGLVWSALLLAPPVVAAVSIAVLPWGIAADLTVVQPAHAMGRFFAENFERRTGSPLSIVTGDPRLAVLVALGAPSRPSLYIAGTPQRSPWIKAEDIVRKGAVVVWPASDAEGLPPPEIKRLFPDIAHEVPRAFERLVQGRLPLLRIGWGVIRPQGVSPSQ
jgi:hypothetical protein